MVPDQLSPAWEAMHGEHHRACINILLYTQDLSTQTYTIVHKRSIYTNVYYCTHKIYLHKRILLYTKDLFTQTYTIVHTRSIYTNVYYCTHKIYLHKRILLYTQDLSTQTYTIVHTRSIYTNVYRYQKSGRPSVTGYHITRGSAVWAGPDQWCITGNALTTYTAYT